MKESIPTVILMFLTRLNLIRKMNRDEARKIIYEGFLELKNVIVIYFFAAGTQLVLK